MLKVLLFMFNKIILLDLSYFLIC